MLDADQYILTNLFNTNSETEKAKIWEELQSLLKNLDKHLIFAGDFNIRFNSKLETKRGKPFQKRNFIAKLVEMRESLDICGIWRIRNPKNHSTGFIECWLDYISISKYLQEFVYDTVITCSINWSFPITDLFLSDKSDKMVTVFGNLIIL